MKSPALPFVRPINVLVVDDEPANRELIRDTLEVRGYTVTESGDGAAALALIAAAAPDVVLLDVSMPGLDGLEVCRQLKGSPLTASLPVIMVTAHTDRRARLAGIEAGANDYLSKPIDLPDLVLRVRNAGIAKRLADDVRETLRQLKELEALRDGLTHMVIHDLRSPLAVIMMSLELLQQTPATPDREREMKFVDICFSNAQRMNGMVTTLLDVSRLEAGAMPLHKTTTKLGPLIADTLESMRRVSAARQITLSGPDDDATVLCDEALVRRPLGNLVDNAIKFTPDRGDIRVTLAIAGTEVQVGVSDAGPGIAPEDHAKIFEKFGQAAGERARLGTGLGLTFCKLAAEAHGGRIGLESVVGAGSTFWFTLPSV